MQVSWDMTGIRLGYSYRQLQIISSYYSGIFFFLKKNPQNNNNKHMD